MGSNITCTCKEYSASSSAVKGGRPPETVDQESDDSTTFFFREWLSHDGGLEIPGLMSEEDLFAACTLWSDAWLWKAMTCRIGGTAWILPTQFSIAPDLHIRGNTTFEWTGIVILSGMSSNAVKNSTISFHDNQEFNNSMGRNQGSIRQVQLNPKDLNF